MRIAFFLLLWWTLSAYAEDPRGNLNDGAKFYEKGQFDKAESAFDAAIDGAPGAKLDPAVAKYNKANALMNERKADEASRYYQEALQTTDLGLQKRAYFNRGNALMSMAAPAEQQGKLDDAKKAVEEALNMYVGAMTLDPSDADPKVNYELALNKKKELEKKQEQQQQQQNQQNKNDNKDQNKDQQNQQQQDQQKRDQEKKDQEKKDQQQQQQDKKDQQQQQNQDQKKPGDEQQQNAAKPEEMTPQEAVQLLDALKQQEQADREKIRVNSGRPVPVEKDW